MPSPDKPLRIGCLGAARIAPPALVFPTHVRGDVELTAVAARDQARAQAFADSYRFERTEPDYASLVAATDIDLVYNPLPVNLHAEWSIKALEAGKHVLCEKPLAMNAAEARAMLAAAEASGTRLIEAFHYRYHPSFATYLHWLRERRIGRLTRIDASFTAPIDDNNGKEIRHLRETGGGAFMDLGCYPLSWTLMSTDSVPAKIEAEASLTSRGVDETLQATLVFEDGLEAQLQASMASDRQFEAHVEVTGTHGRIDFSNPLAPHTGSTLTLINDNGEETIETDPLSTYFRQLDAIVRAIETGASMPTEGEAILRQQQVLDAIYAAAGIGHLRRQQPAR